jgi:hypothetical protein
VSANVKTEEALSAQGRGNHRPDQVASRHWNSVKYPSSAAQLPSQVISTPVAQDGRHQIEQDAAALRHLLIALSSSSFRCLLRLCPATAAENSSEFRGGATVAYCLQASGGSAAQGIATTPNDAAADSPLIHDDAYFGREKLRAGGLEFCSRRSL